MQLKDIVLEGAFVVKNKDGVEKRFKDADSAAAKAWKETSKKYGMQWWVNQNLQHANDDSFVVPWTPMFNYGTGDFTDKHFQILAKDNDFGPSVEDWHSLRTGSMKVDGITVATAEIRLEFKRSAVDAADSSESQNILIRRDTKDPKKFVFVKYL